MVLTIQCALCRCEPSSRHTWHSFARQLRHLLDDDLVVKNKEAQLFLFFVFPFLSFQFYFLKLFVTLRCLSEEATVAIMPEVSSPTRYYQTSTYLLSICDFVLGFCSLENSTPRRRLFQLKTARKSSFREITARAVTSSL